MTSLWRDLTSAARALRRQPLFAGSTILTLGLGLGVVTGFFAIVDAVLLKPIAAHGDTVVRIWKLDPQRSIARYPLSYPELALWGERQQSAQRIAAISYADTHTAALFLGDDSVPVTISPVSADFFPVLHDGPPLLGRWLLPSDDGNRVELAAVASERFWQRVGGGNPAFVGQRLRWPGSSRAMVIVGVAPSSMTYPAGADLWVPIDGYFGTDSGNPNLDLNSRRFANFHFLARLRPGITVDAARTELEVVSRGVVSAYPDDYRPMAINVEPLLEATLGTLRPLTLFLFAGAALVFLAAGGNVAALLIMRAAAQTRDIAVLFALGASRGRILRQTLVESAVLGVGGALTGLVIAHLCVRLAHLVAGAQIPRIEEAAVNGQVLGFCIGAALLWVVTLGAAPVWHRRRVDPGHLTSQLTSRTTRQAAMLRAMVVGQVAVGVIVAAAAVLLLRSFGHLSAIDRGVEVSRLAVIALALPETSYATPASREALFSRLLARLRALPGAIDATTVHLGPGTGQAGLSARMTFEGQQPEDARINPYGTWEPVMPSYFATLGIPITQGRGFTDSDDREAPPVAVVSESVARRYWPGQNPIGRRLQFTPQFPWTTVVGVVADTRYRELTREWLTVYFPAKQFFFFSPGNVVVRTAVPPATLAGEFRRAISSIEPAAAVRSVDTMDQLMASEVARPRAAAMIGTLFALVAVIVVGIGVYAVFSFEITHRRRELAVHAAVGASPARILGATLRQGLALGAIGTIAGMAAASWLTQFLAAVLFEVAPLDALSFALAAGGLLVIVTLASLAPARRAARVDPAVLLRSE
jgi:putative ABC transport system permease protein